MNIVDKLIDPRQMPDQSMNRAENPAFNFPDFRGWPDSLISSTAGLFRGNMFPLTPNQLSRSLKLSSSSSSNGLDLMPAIINKDSENEEEDFCEKCQKKFCNKYYLKKHKIEVHKSELEQENSFENFHLLSDPQPKSPLFRPSPFNPLFNSSFSNFLLQKSMAPMFANMLLPQPPLLPQSSQLNAEFSTAPSSSTPIFRPSQSGPILNSTDLLTSCHNSFSIPTTTEQTSKLPNLATSIFNEVRNSFIKSPLETKPFLNLNLLDTGFHDLNRSLGQTITCTICNIQVTGGESCFLDHLYSCHNTENSSTNSPNHKLPSKKDSSLSPVTNSDAYISPFDAFKSSMAAAKLADRVTCDICHKDLCNKYFLRTHKLKLHGIQTVDSNGRSGNRKEKLGFFERGPQPFDQPIESPHFLTSPFPRSSLPEHVLAASLFQNPNIPTPLSPEQGCFCPICKRLISLPYFLPLHMWNVHGIGMRNPNGFLPSASDTGPNIEATPLEQTFLPIGMPAKLGQTLFPIPFVGNGLETSSIGSKWYRKSPNQMRVRCDICDKWICNKYFLRTHKLNKHGLTDSGSNTDVNSDSVSRSYFVDASQNVHHTSSVSIDTHTSVPQLGNALAFCDSSPIDLSASPARENRANKGTNITANDGDKKHIPNFSCSSIMADIHLRSAWNAGLGPNWPLRFTFDRINNTSLTLNTTNNTSPLDLSTKFLKASKRIPKSDDQSVNNSLTVSTAKKLKIKYQKITKIRTPQKLSQSDHAKSKFVNQSFSPARKNECFNCPLCGKELQEAPRFLQHLTQFHDMVLPGNHSGTSVSSNQS